MNSCRQGLAWLLLPLSLHHSASSHNAWWLILGFGLVWLLRPIQPVGWGAVIGCLAVAALLWLPAADLPLAQLLPVMILGSLAALFGSTLLPGRVALIGRVAQAMKDPWTPQLERYTWRLTLSWVLLFTGLATSSALLAWNGPLWLWSLFTNLLSYVLIGLMFIVEFLLRNRFVDSPRQSFGQFMQRLVQVMPQVLAAVMKGRGDDQ